MEMFAYMSEGIGKLQIPAFRSYVGSFVTAPQVFQFCLTEGQLVNQEFYCSNKILSISQLG